MARKIRTKMVARIHEIAFHRNGISGNGFYAVRFKATEGYEMIATIFEEQGNISVLRADMLFGKEATVEFGGGNSWRGDQYEGELRAALDAWSEERFGKGNKAFR